MPLANAYLNASDLDQAEDRYPLNARVCDRCWLVQLDHVIAPEILFDDYAYFSSFSDTWLEHAREFAGWAVDTFRLHPESCVVEVASNDGYLLKHFIDRGIPVLGIEPAVNIAEAARAAGIPTDIRFFGKEVARDLREQGFVADLLVGNNVVAHAPDINDFVAGLALLIGPEGVISLEFPHLLQLVEGIQFDTIYHEHSFYLSLHALETILERHELTILDVVELETHGGSLRVLATPLGNSKEPTEASETIRRKEDKAGLRDIDTFHRFAERVDRCRAELRAFLDRCKSDGKTVVAYGAAAKGNTLLNYCDINSRHISYVVDRSPHKQGLFLPGSHLPIRHPDAVQETKPDYLVVLPWNLKDEIVAQMSSVREWGGRFVIPVPQVQVLE